jgi:uncharacterized membrane protein YoaK (UPF0700 family)
MTKKNVSIGMGGGVALAVALGSATHNFALWFPIGLVMGMCVTQALRSVQEAK